MKKHNRLNSQQFIKLSKWFESNFDQCLHRQDAAERATEGVGFLITIENIDHICKVYDVKLPRMPRQPKPVAVEESKVDPVSLILDPKVDPFQFIAAQIYILNEKIGIPNDNPVWNTIFNVEQEFQLTSPN